MGDLAHATQALGILETSFPVLALGPHGHMSRHGHAMLFVRVRLAGNEHFLSARGLARGFGKAGRVRRSVGTWMLLGTRRPLLRVQKLQFLRHDV